MSESSAYKIVMLMTVRTAYIVKNYVTCGIIRQPYHLRRDANLVVQRAEKPGLALRETLYS